MVFVSSVTLWVFCQSPLSSSRLLSAYFPSPMRIPSELFHRQLFQLSKKLGKKLIKWNLNGRTRTHNNHICIKFALANFTIAFHFFQLMLSLLLLTLIERFFCVLRLWWMTKRKQNQRRHFFSVAAAVVVIIVVIAVAAVVILSLVVFLFVS